MFYTVTTQNVEGDALKLVYCENCTCNFHYVVTRSAQGQAVGLIPTKGGDSRAERGAMKALDKKFDKAIDLVACPECGKFQTQMIKDKRKKLIVGGLVTSIFTTGGAFMFALYLSLNSKDLSLGTTWLMLMVPATLLAAAIPALGFHMFKPNEGKFFFFSKDFVGNGFVIEDEEVSEDGFPVQPPSDGIDPTQEFYRQQSF